MGYDEVNNEKYFALKILFSPSLGADSVFKVQVQN